ncbi:uncharacterized protein HD556DRAFT_778316 [Suillus plorans]|uniref:Heterokaryon incompatibility domain-containing protein n=1 Tax=Suillus plorans TaxID=116603 RepID=A0A9P7AJC7_9AGAM|nr:uncharacterized protein HD556DRAFT_778316 [Suillus plorans]KAG1789554.1 hypothetical protein HD556DRAFT_778316 [Suillus plorans]
MLKPIPITTPLREFNGHEQCIMAAAVFPDKRLVTGSHDKTVRLWDLETGVALKMEMHRGGVSRLAVSQDEQLIASGDLNGEVVVWHGETGELLSQPIEAHPGGWISSLDFSPDGTVLATCSKYGITKLWNTKTWTELEGRPIKCGDGTCCVRYSPSGEFLAIATSRIDIYNPGTRELVASFKGHKSHTFSLVWTADGTRLLTGGAGGDPTIREWDTATWKQVGDPWTGHSNYINLMVINPAGTLIASVSPQEGHVRLWRVSDRQTVAIFEHSLGPEWATFSMDGKHILSGGNDKMISEWAVPNIINSKILGIMTARIACIDGDLSTAEELLTQDINIDENNHTSYAHRSFVMARKHNWDHAVQDAITSISIQPSLIGFISKGIALCGKGRILDARAAFDVASMYTDQDPDTIHFLLLIKAIALFNAGQHDEASLLLKELAAGCPNVYTRPYRIVEAYLHVQLEKALDGAHYAEAADHFIAAVNSNNSSSKFNIHEIYEDLVVIFGWDLKCLWLTTHQKRCDALLQAREFQDAVKLYWSMMDSSDENTMADYLDWSNVFKEECSALCIANGDIALAASEYDRAIDLYSAAIALDSASDIVFANRSKAKLEKMLWEEAVLDAQKVTELNPSSHVGYQLTHTALHGAKRYDEAIEAFTIMLSKLDDAPEVQIRSLRQQYVCPSQAEDAIRRAVWIELENAPLRLLNTSTGLLCDRAAQLNSFKMSSEYNELITFPTKDSNLRTQRIKDVVATYFRCVLLSHRWEEAEVLLHDIQDKVVYELDGLGGIAKLQSFCKVVRDAGYYWAWMDTCCIDKKSNITELQESINSMFVWYRNSALTIVYLSDIPSSSQPGALVGSAWNERGWTFQELVAPQVVIFYQKDWSLYLGDRSPNHKESPAIMKELEDATGIDARALVNFSPGMRGAREKLQWASKRVTTLQEDIAYSLFGIFGITLPVIYGEKKQNALGRLLQEIVARSGDITVLDWIGQPSEFNSCLPAHITSYTTPPCALSSLSEDDIQTQVSSLRQNPTVVDSALELYDRLDYTSAARFANCRLHLPCMAFRVTEVSLNYGPSQETQYKVKADGLRDLLITTKELNIHSRTRPVKQTFLIVRPWDRSLLDLPDFANLLDDTESEGDYRTPPLSPSDDSPSHSPVKQDGVDLELRALRLLVRLGQPFGAFLLARQRGGEYKRVASDRDIIAQVKDMSSVQDLLDIKTIEIL